MIVVFTVIKIVVYSDKGVKVELGIPYDLWDSPSAEVTKMQRKVSD
jgi:hypothetical protein